MEVYNDGKEKMIVLTQEELMQVFKTSKIPLLWRAWLETKTHEELEGAISEISVKGAHDRDEHEVFIALFDIATYFPSGKIGFGIKSELNPTHAVQTLEELNAMRLVDDNCDAAIFTEDSIRKYQLKRYRGQMTTDGLFEFLSGKLHSYGYNLGKINLWVILQPIPFGESTIDFVDLHERIKQLPLVDCGEILITFNDQNKDKVLQRIYPEPGGRRTPLNLYSI